MNFQETKAALSGNLAASSSGAPRRRQFDLSQSGLSSSDVDALHERLSSTYRADRAGGVSVSKKYLL